MADRAKRSFELVGRVGFEPTQSKTPDLQSGWLQPMPACPFAAKTTTCLPSSQEANPELSGLRWCGRGGSNSHVFRQRVLKPPRLPVPPLPRSHELLVGVRGFEPPAPASRTRCATRLRYTPIHWYCRRRPQEGIEPSSLFGRRDFTACLPVPPLWLASAIRWCGREDSNFHGLSPTATSTLCVYQFRHVRKLY